VVLYPPGGLTDVMGRLIGERLRVGLGQPAVIDNKPGAATQLGASYVAKAPPDGYTLLLATVSTPDVPPLTDFFPGFDLQPWMSIAGPAGLPMPVVARLNGELNKALVDPIFIQRLRDVGLAATPLTVEAFGELIKRDAARWAELVKLSGAKAE
jgi:tripartite-type tricarboxylate transporter receptor subunit TctC